MKINYKQPYWIKFEWDLSSHHENQYVTEFNKSENDLLTNILFNQSFIITCNFVLKSEYKGDEMCTIFGKSGKNLALRYNKLSNDFCFEFWTNSTSDDTFNSVFFKTVTLKDLEEGVTITIIRDKQKITLYKNFIEDNHINFDGEFIDDYKRPGLFLGCCNPNPHPNSFAGFTEVDMNHFSFIINSSDIEHSKKIHEDDVERVHTNNFYNDIVFLYNFNTINNLGIVYDESKNTNFLEKVPKEFII